MPDRSKLMCKSKEEQRAWIPGQAGDDGGRCEMVIVRNKPQTLSPTPRLSCPMNINSGRDSDPLVQYSPAGANINYECRITTKCDHREHLGFRSVSEEPRRGEEVRIALTNQLRSKT